MSSIVKARNISKSYSGFPALSSVNFDIQKGSIVGLIGPNGAGKTTTLKSLLGLCSFEGDLEVLGCDPRHGRHHLMERVCFIADVGILPGWMKVNQVVEFVKGVHPKFNEKRAWELLDTTAIPFDKKIKNLSKGMITQLHLALVMSINVELLVLDEPTLGLDILYRKEFYNRLLNDYFDSERSIIISTHQVEEIEALLSHLLFIDQGEIVLDSPMDELAEKYVEVLVNSDDVDKALQLNPIYQREMLGRKGMLFRDVNRDELAGLGELQVPSVSDLFVAIMKGGRAQ
jgi:ABC-2 type transport system ATP-binding protein